MKKQTKKKSSSTTTSKSGQSNVKHKPFENQYQGHYQTQFGDSFGFRFSVFDSANIFSIFSHVHAFYCIMKLLYNEIESQLVEFAVRANKSRRSLNMVTFIDEETTFPVI